VSDAVPRVRMFAGPNGSGKTTVKNSLQRPASWFGLYINPDELEQTVRESGFLSLGPFDLATTTAEVQGYFASSAFLQGQHLHEAARAIVCRDGGIDFSGLTFNSYYASVLADFLRRKALDAGTSFTFETVMSSRDKVELLRTARQQGYRTYLYFIATEDPAINIQRVQNRVAEGGHDVPQEKIVARYHRSLALLPEAVRHTDRAYFFDTSEEHARYVAEITDGAQIELKGDEIPHWFRPVWDQFGPEAPSPPS
jgi:predicted ABC-type ATPase